MFSAHVLDARAVGAREGMQERFRKAGHRGSPLNRWLDQPIQDRREGSRNTSEVIERYLSDGTYAGPDEVADTTGAGSTGDAAAGRRASV